MKRKWISGLAGLLAAAALLTLMFVAVGTAQAPQSETEVQPASAETPPPQREREADPNAPAISFIDSPTATCYRPAAETSDACYIEWPYLYVTASASQYIISMTLEIDGRKRAYYSGFFQTSMYAPGEMYLPGFKVSCGVPGSNPDPRLGKSYSYTIRARETGGLSAANYGSVTCPAGPRKIFLPLAVRR
jgi:hypothetical protein